MQNRERLLRGVRNGAVVVLSAASIAFKAPSAPSISEPKPSSEIDTASAGWCEPAHDVAHDRALRDARSPRTYADRLRTLSWYPMAEYFGNQYQPAVPAEITLSLIHTESKGRNTYDRQRVSYGLFQIHTVHDQELLDRFGRDFDELSAEQQFTFMMPRIAKAYAQGVKLGLRGARL